MLIHVVQTSGVGCWVNLSHIAAIIEETNGGFTLHFAQETAGGLKSIELDRDAVSAFVESSAQQ